MKAIKSDKAPNPIGPYSQAIEANGFIFCSGQIGVDVATGTIAEGVEEQTRQVMKNLEFVLNAANSDFDHVVKTTIFLKNISDFPTVNEIYGSYFSSHKPARATVEVSNLPKGKLSNSPLVEIEMIAVAK